MVRQDVLKGRNGERSELVIVYETERGRRKSELSLGQILWTLYAWGGGAGERSEWTILWKVEGIF